MERTRVINPGTSFGEECTRNGPPEILWAHVPLSSEIRFEGRTYPLSFPGGINETNLTGRFGEVAVSLNSSQLT